VWKKLCLTLAALCLVTPVTGSAGAEEIFPFKIHEKTLDNGMRLVVIPYDSPGTIAYMTVVRTGSRDEVEPGHSGFAHFFEHMMFRGTEKYSGDEYNDLLKRMGADSNADTSDDRTRYYITGPSAELETMMDMESDRFMNLSYSEEDFRREALAVLGEYNKNISNPFLPMWERMRELAFKEHTYSHTTMGYLEDIKAMPDYYDYSLGFFDRFYRPENCILLVVGDATPEEVFTLAEKYYGDWQQGYQEPTVTSEPPQTEAFRSHIDWAAPIRPYLMAGYKAPAWSADDVDIATLDLIGQLLFSESAPLYQKLMVEEQWVDFIQGGYADHRDPFLFMIFGRIKSDDLVESVEGTIDEYIAQLQNEPVDEIELERIKSHMRYQFALGLDSPDAIQDTIGNYLILTGDPKDVSRIYAQYQKVTPEDVQRVAREIFQPNQSTTVTLSYPAEQGEAGGAATGAGR
jgi:zinc protease